MWTLLFVFGACVLPIGVAALVIALGRQSLEGLVDAGESEKCRSRLASVARALRAYSEDNDGRLPPGSRWVDAVWPYGSKKDPAGESESVFRCPTISKLRTGEYGYALYVAAAGTRLAELETREGVPLVFDSTALDRNAVSDASSLPNPPRHSSGKENFRAMTNGSVSPWR
jgi:hypothetical protein